ncbi:hypothetical protein QMK17_08040 [Rhodococcus sp. G-MC3]|uniref:hypothetical protein n=1 Tax=Rhodococcus sp. G-MC3 TaxID=3046209 RepID=UPI0024BA7025|nr:hypothetical protein [Rhodococcus sp. G-MC3]MDJ0393280.1 hypothetical protein [Rhodococcus sp. G-MC3]
MSADGYYEDAYDFESLIEHVLQPLGPDGAGLYRRGIIVLASDTPTEAETLFSPTNAVLVIDGTFLHRAPLTEYWDREGSGGVRSPLPRGVTPLPRGSRSTRPRDLRRQQRSGVTHRSTPLSVGRTEAADCPQGGPAQLRHFLVHEPMRCTFYESAEGCSSNSRRKDAQVSSATQTFTLISETLR